MSLNSFLSIFSKKEKDVPSDVANAIVVFFVHLQDGEGKMVPFHPDYPRRACAVHCLARGSRDYFAPVLEFEKVDELKGWSPYFPDGTR